MTTNNIRSGLAIVSWIFIVAIFVGVIQLLSQEDAGWITIKIGFGIAGIGLVLSMLFTLFGIMGILEEIRDQRAPPKAAQPSEHQASAENTQKVYEITPP